MNTWFEIEVGRLLLDDIRGIIQREKFKGRDIEFIEGKGFFTRDFVVKGNRADVREVKKRIDKLIKSMGN
jgi:hypothetical protein